MGKPPVGARGGDHLITKEYFENVIRPLVNITKDDLDAMEAAGLVRFCMWTNSFSFTPSSTLPFDGSPNAIAAEFKIRKLFLQARRLTKKP